MPKNNENNAKNGENKPNNNENTIKTNKKVKIRFITGYWGIYGVFQPKQVAELPETVANRFVKDGIAEIPKDEKIMLITAALLYAYNGIEQKEDETSQQLIEIHIGTAQQIISNYVLFDCETVLTDSEHFDSAAVAMFKNVCLRIATLLQLEDGGNIGVNNNSSIGVNRTFANIVDYTPYLKPLSAFRKIEGA